MKKLLNVVMLTLALNFLAAAGGVAYLFHSGALSKEKVAATEAQDKGFQDSLALYNSMQPKQVKDVFTSLDDATVMKYLRAMDPSRAAKIIKEFKTPADTERVQRIIEMIRAQQAGTQ